MTRRDDEGAHLQGQRELGKSAAGLGDGQGSCQHFFRELEVAGR